MHCRGAGVGTRFIFASSKLCLRQLKDTHRDTYKGTHRNRQTDTHTQTQRQTHTRDTDTHTDTHTNTCMDTHPETHIQTQAHTNTHVLVFKLIYFKLCIVLYVIFCNCPFFVPFYIGSTSSCCCPRQAGFFQLIVCFFVFICFFGCRSIYRDGGQLPLMLSCPRRAITGRLIKLKNKQIIFLFAFLVVV